MYSVHDTVVYDQSKMCLVTDIGIILDIKGSLFSKTICLYLIGYGISAEK